MFFMQPTIISLLFWRNTRVIICGTCLVRWRLGLQFFAGIRLLTHYSTTVVTPVFLLRKSINQTIICRSHRYVFFYISSSQHIIQCQINLNMLFILFYLQECYISPWNNRLIMFVKRAGCQWLIIFYNAYLFVTDIRNGPNCLLTSTICCIEMALQRKLY